ncbi:GNAT family N-acetyltransferase [Cytobacillus kochii]|uniref:GNAT family N-acetyltransferase n=1 Tax=Cytobacillus kochii TaxID=859143 RepID=UPI00203C46A1|nr:GNAT family N-acetyltransferase [Cytobacillus kochii]MCM3323464.1 GNAT family N-acetyltransferase [Cytobacillus kochii]MCM3345859.1 GNAT family N-acetyltransferase [Cytobacillus kochii]
MTYRLTRLSNDDAKELFKFEKVNKQFFEKSVPPRPVSYEIYEQFLQVLIGLLEEQAENKSLFYLIKNETDEIVGRINIVDIDWREKKGYLGYRIGEAYTGKGIATHALQILLQQNKEINHLLAKTTKDNISSQKVLERNDFGMQGVEGNFIYYQWDRKLDTSY